MNKGPYVRIQAKRHLPVLFGQTGEWKHVRLGGVDLINVGALKSRGCYRYALIEWKEGDLDVRFGADPVENKSEGAVR